VSKGKFEIGMVVWAKVPDRNGHIKANPRPLLVTSVHPANKKASFVANCISTRLDNRASDPTIEMPSHPKTGAGLGLFCRCVVVLRWMVNVEQSRVVDVTGKVDPEFLNYVLTRIKQIEGLFRP
jgi:mRNA-degrading endonuclease toxin of MazEF toxin-antitoxin module